MTDHGACKVWRESAGETEDTATVYRAWDAKAAAESAAMYDHAQRDGWEWTWPVVYTVRDMATGALWAIEVDREQRPHFVASKPRVIPMPPMVHVLWGAQVVCEDLRLRGVPATWPADQTWISLVEFKEPSPLAASVTCEVCARRAPGLAAGLLQIGAV